MRIAAGRLPRPAAGRLLSFGGGGILVLIIAVWVVMLVLGFALVALPHLGTSIRASRGETPTDFAAAVYFSGGNLSTAASADLSRKTVGCGWWRPWRR